VVPFRTLGTVEAEDAGKILAERLLPHLADSYELVDRGQLKEFLDQADLTLAGLAEQMDDKKKPVVKLAGVRYLVVGTVSVQPDSTYAVVARLTDWQDGRVVRLGRIAAADWNDLIESLGLLAGQLTGQIDARQMSEGLVERQENKLVVRVIASGSDDLERLAKARSLSRAAFARYSTEAMASQYTKAQLLEYARDNESIVDAELRGSALRYVVSFPLPKGQPK
jgi:hypothetical protein